MKQATCKVVMAGNSGVGKTCIINKYANDTFNPRERTTFGVKFAECAIRCCDDAFVKTIVWDTAGQEAFQSFSQGYFRDADGAIIVYSVDDHNSFTNVSYWIGKCREFGVPEIPIILVGNKVDIYTRCVSYNEGSQLANVYKLADFFETSAQTGRGITTVFASMAQHVREKSLGDMIQLSTFELSHTPEKHRSYCCGSGSSSGSGSDSGSGNGGYVRVSGVDNLYPKILSYRS